MKLKRNIFLFYLIVVFLMFELSALAWCPPGTVPANPAPVKSEKPHSSGEDCIVKVLDDFKLGEEVTETLNLTAGKSYWFAANGCPKDGDHCYLCFRQQRRNFEGI